MQFEKITLDQKSDEWKQWRAKGIGASDAPVILGLSPYMKPHRLWEEKLGLRDGNKMNSFIEERAARIESAARATLEIEMGKQYPSICVQSVEHPWLKGSFDGYNEETNSIMEAKYVGAGKEVGKIPAHHWVQMQHQMMLVNAPDVVYMRSSNGITFHSLIVARDDNYIKMMFDEEKKFWEMVLKHLPPTDERRKAGWRTDVKLAENVEA